MVEKKLKKDHSFRIIIFGLAVVAGTLFLLNLLPSVVAWMEVQHWGWFLGIAVLFAIMAFKKLLFK